MRYINFVFLSLLSYGSCQAANVGVIGQTYPIAEESALTMIMNKLKEKEKSGLLKKYQAEAVKRSLNSIKNMPPVEGLQVVTHYSQRMIDPTVKYKDAIKTDEGTIVVPAGATINPLLITGLSKRLVFFDGRDKEQVAAVRKMVAIHKLKVKPILVAGSWLDLSKSWKTQVYYDQKGILSKRFGVSSVPSVISQKGNFLMLQEFPAKDLK